MPDLSVIVLSKNQGYFETLDACLIEQEGVEGVSFEKLLVNNSNSVALTSRALGRGWMVVEPGYNTSFSIGNNLAAKAARGDSLLLLNDDVRPVPTFLQNAWAHRGEADVLGALLLHGHGTVNHAGAIVKENGVTDHVGRGGDPAPYRDRCYPVAAVTFAAVLIRKALWDDLGGLDERYYYGWEDVDFCLRAIRSGAAVRCCGCAEAYHDECGTRPRGGSNDANNFRQFISVWQRDLPRLLADYRRRMKPEAVEGA